MSSLPRFMLRRILSPNPGADVSQAHASGDATTMINFNLLPGEISRESRSKDTSLNKRFSEIVLGSNEAPPKRFPDPQEVTAA